MEKHYNENELIEFQFGLAEQDVCKQIEEHLQQCQACTELNDKLKAKFASLELLRDKTAANEELIQGVLASIKAKPKRIMLPAWLSAAAAMVIVVGLLITLNVNKPDIDGSKQQDSPAVESKPEGTHLLSKNSAGTRSIQPTSTSLVEKHAADIELAWAKDKDVFAKAPFAPASAIELVVLPKRQNVQITIYNEEDLTLVRETRKLTLKKGWNWLQFMWANTLIDPTSLQLEPTEYQDRVSIEQLVFPPRLQGIGRWLIRSEVEGQVAFELTYFTSGVSWRAFYMGTLNTDETQMQLKSYVRVDNRSGEDFENTKTRLVVGKVNLIDNIAELAQKKPFRYQWGYQTEEEFGEHGTMLGLNDKKDKNNNFYAPVDSGFNGNEKVPMLGDMPFMGGLFKPKEILRKGLSEYVLYTIEDTEDILNQWGKRLLSFEADNIDVNSLYKYDENRYGQQAMRFISFVNDTEHNLGATPLPAGNIRIFGVADDDGMLVYVGSSDAKYIPLDEEVELNMGSARLVKVEPVLMNFKSENFTYDNDGNINGWDEVRNWRIAVTNTKTIPVDIEITRGFNTSYWDMELNNKRNVEYEKYDLNQARFNLKAAPRSKEIFNYTVRTYYGLRRDDYEQ